MRAMRVTSIGALSTTHDDDLSIHPIHPQTIDPPHPKTHAPAPRAPSPPPPPGPPAAPPTTQPAAAGRASLPPLLPSIGSRPAVRSCGGVRGGWTSTAMWDGGGISGGRRFGASERTQQPQQPIDFALCKRAGAWLVRPAQQGIQTTHHNSPTPIVIIRYLAAPSLARQQPGYATGARPKTGM